MTEKEQRAYQEAIHKVLQPLTRDILEKLRRPTMDCVRDASTKRDQDYLALWQAGLVQMAGHVLGNVAVNIGQRRDFARMFATNMTKAFPLAIEAFLRDYEEGDIEVGYVGQFDATTGKEVPFDFRDHLKPDSGRTSEIGG